MMMIDRANGRLNAFREDESKYDSQIFQRAIRASISPEYDIELIYLDTLYISRTLMEGEIKKL